MEPRTRGSDEDGSTRVLAHHPPSWRWTVARSKYTVSFTKRSSSKSKTHARRIYILPPLGFMPAPRCSMASAHPGFHDDRSIGVVGLERLEMEVAKRVHETGDEFPNRRFSLAHRANRHDIVARTMKTHDHRVEATRVLGVDVSPNNRFTSRS